MKNPKLFEGVNKIAAHGRAIIALTNEILRPGLLEHIHIGKLYRVSVPSEAGKKPYDKDATTLPWRTSTSGRQQKNTLQAIHTPAPPEKIVRRRYEPVNRQISTPLIGQPKRPGEGAWLTRRKWTWRQNRQRLEPKILAEAILISRSGKPRCKKTGSTLPRAPCSLEAFKNT